MSGLWGHLVGVLILVMMTVFIGIWFWAWRPRHRRVFDALAEIPMMDGDLADNEIPMSSVRPADHEIRYGGAARGGIATVSGSAAGGDEGTRFAAPADRGTGP